MNCMSSRRANNLAVRLEQGARALASLAAGLEKAEWGVAIPHDGRTIGVVVHHVARMYPREIKLAQILAAGKAIEGVTSDDVDRINAKHAAEFADVTKEAALDLLGVATAGPRRQPYGRSATRTWIAPLRCRCMATRR